MRKTKNNFWFRMDSKDIAVKIHSKRIFILSLAVSIITLTAGILLTDTTSLDTPIFVLFTFFLSFSALGLSLWNIAMLAPVTTIASTVFGIILAVINNYSVTNLIAASLIALSVVLAGLSMLTILDAPISNHFIMKIIPDSLMRYSENKYKTWVNSLIEDNSITFNELDNYIKGK